MSYDWRTLDPRYNRIYNNYINEVKSEFNQVLRACIYPNETRGTTEVKLGGSIYNTEIAQSFYPLTTLYNGRAENSTLTVRVKLKRNNNPTGNVVMSLHEDNNNSPSTVELSSSTISWSSIGTVPTTISFDFVLTRPLLNSMNKYWLKFYPNFGASTINDYSVYSGKDYLFGSYSYKNTNESNWTTTNTLSTWFDVQVPDWIYEAFPADTLNLESYPRISVAFLDRVEYDPRYIDWKKYIQKLGIGIVVYSLYPEECDMLVEFADRSIRRWRINFSSADWIDPDRITPMTVLRNKLFVRTAVYLARQRVSTQE